MMPNWPWKRSRAAGQLVVGSFADRFAYAQTDATGALRRCGLEHIGGDSSADFARRLRGLGLPAQQVCAVLPLADGQLLPVDAPAVKPEELKAAARWRVKELVEGRLDELTIDVMFVGDERPRPNRQVFVAAARNTLLREIGERTRAAGMELTVVDIAETAQRNLQSAMAQSRGLGERATAALMRYGEQCLLTICAGGELYYARRLEWEGVAPAAAAPERDFAAPDSAALESMDFVDYGAEPEQGAGQRGEAPRLVVELQRSFDVWERSWPDLPLAALWVQVGDDSSALAMLLEAELGQRVGVLDPDALFPGFADATPEVRAAVLPILGALLRQETRRL